jgi:hypothetical protein
MSDTIPTPASSTPNDDFLAAPLAFAIVAAVAAAIFLVWLTTLCRIMPESTVLLLAGVAIFGIGWPITPPIVLALLASILADAPGHWLGVLPSFGQQLSFAELALSANFIIYAALTYRFQQADRRMQQSHSAGESASSAAGRDAGRLLTIVTVGFILATLARWILPLLYLGRAMAPSLALVPAVSGFLVAIILLGLAGWIWNVLVRSLGREGMSPVEARLILNHEEDQELGTELRILNRQLGRNSPQTSLLRPTKM